MNRIVVLSVLVFGIAGCGEISSNNSPLSIAEINKRQVIGNLGLPLIETATVRATIVDGDTLRLKGFSSTYLLSVTSVNGTPLLGDRLFRFAVPPPYEQDDDFGLVSGSWEFSELSNRKHGKRFTEEGIDELRASYAGTKLLLKAYEIGSFYGDDDPGTAELGIKTPHYLATKLIVLSAVRDSGN